MATQEEACREKTYWPGNRYLDRPRFSCYDVGYDTTVYHRLGSPRSKNGYDYAWECSMPDAVATRTVSTRPILFTCIALGGIIVKEHYDSQKHTQITWLMDSCRPSLNQRLDRLWYPSRRCRPSGPLPTLAEKAARAAGFTDEPESYETLLP